MANGLGLGGHQSARALTESWLTPPHIIEALGGADSFDLDPCAFPGWPTAKRGISLPEDGLAAAWEGRIWLNPPYGAQTWAWLERLAAHGRGTALIFARTETEGFVRRVWSAEPAPSALLFLAGRLFFHQTNGEKAKSNSGAPSVLIAWGEEDGERLANSGLPGALVEGWSLSGASA